MNCKRKLEMQSHFSAVATLGRAKSFISSATKMVQTVTSEATIQSWMFFSSWSFNRSFKIVVPFFNHFIDVLHHVALLIRFTITVIYGATTAKYISKCVALTGTVSYHFFKWCTKRFSRKLWKGAGEFNTDAYGRNVCCISPKNAPSGTNFPLQTSF